MKLLRLLGDGTFHSGEALGRALGVSRAAIWKQIEGWKAIGLEFDVLPGKGYRLASPFDALQASNILSHISTNTRQLISELIVLEQIDSTNDEVMRRIRHFPRSGIVCLAEEQLAGRGRRGREWLSPIGMNFCGSVGWVFHEGVSAVEGLSLAVGVAVVNALQRYGAEHLGLKWPNDIMLNKAKLGGVLIELHAESDGPCAVVIGVGLNLHTQKNMSEHLARPTAALEQCVSQKINRNKIAALVIEEIIQLLSSYAEKKFASYYEDWQQLDCLKGTPIVIAGVEPVQGGVACGVSKEGALLVDINGEVQAFHGGEVSPKWRESAHG
jgi:BirA family biotin operon repressor/biotin-[acetyl-CoA-carboxylase] ligase